MSYLCSDIYIQLGFNEFIVNLACFFMIESCEENGLWDVDLSGLCGVQGYVFGEGLVY